MICEIDGESCQPGQLTVRTMNFSQPWRGSTLKEVGYRVWLPLGVILRWLSKNVADYVADCQAFPCQDPEPFERLLRERNWPSPEDICRDGVLLLAAVKCFDHALLLDALGDGPPDAPGYILNTVDAIESGGGGVWLSGRGRADSPAPYQDR